MMAIDERLRARGLTLPAAGGPVGGYVPYVEAGGLLHLAGQIPVDASGELMRGRLGEDLDLEAGRAAAVRCALAIVAQVGAALAARGDQPGDFSGMARIVKLNVFVNSAPGFTQQPQVANAASELLVELFGDRGRHARSAVGVAALPLGVSVEIDAIVELQRPT